jgi:integrase
VASITKHPDGRKTVQFTKLTGDGERGTIRLGHVSLRDAQGFCRNLEALISSKASGCELSAATAEWVGDLPEDLAKKLVGFGLIPPRQRAKLGPFIAEYIEGRKDVKAASKTVWRQSERSLVAYFGADKPAERVTKAEAEAFKQHLIGEKLALYTVRKRLQGAKMFFNAMVSRRLIKANPFTGVQVAAVVDESRNVYVPAGHVEKIMDECADAEWRLIVALSRFGGLRCPSEVLSLPWRNVDFGRNRITVVSPKTASHPGGGQRVIPLFPELLAPLNEAFEQAPEGAVYVVTRHRSQAEAPGGWRNSNFRTTFEKMITRAGLEPWAKPFHAMRASCETDLIEAGHRIQVVSRWMGHSPKVAVANYLRVLPEHYDAAVEGRGRPARCNSAAVGAVSKAHQETGNPKNPVKTELCNSCTRNPADGEGFEPPVDLRPQQFSRLPP